jgi:hypothetical protein
MSAESARLAGREHSFEQCADRTDQCGRYRTDSELPAKYRAVKALDGMMMMNSSAEGEEKRMGASIGPVLVVSQDSVACAVSNSIFVLCAPHYHTILSRIIRAPRQSRKAAINPLRIKCIA